MFEKISNAAEKLATNVSESRRGFLVRVGQAALGVTGVVAGLFALPKEAQAGPRSGFCTAALGSFAVLTGYCVCPPNPCVTQRNTTQCSGYGTSIIELCGRRLASSSPCRCT